MCIQTAECSCYDVLSLISEPFHSNNVWSALEGTVLRDQNTFSWTCLTMICFLYRSLQPAVKHSTQILVMLGSNHSDLCLSRFNTELGQTIIESYIFILLWSSSKPIYNIIPLTQLRHALSSCWSTLQNNLCCKVKLAEREQTILSCQLFCQDTRGAQTLCQSSRNQMNQNFIFIHGRHLDRSQV